MIGEPIAAGSLHAFASFAMHSIGAVLSLGAGIWIAHGGERNRPDRPAALIACAMTALWCAFAAAYGPNAMASLLAASARNLAFIFLLFRLFSTDGRDESLRPTRPVIITLALVELFQPVLVIIHSRVGSVPDLAELTFEVSIVLNMLVSVGALVLLHNLFVGAAPAARGVLRWSTLALVGLFAYDLNFFMIAYLADEQPIFLLVLRGIFSALMIALMAMSARSHSVELRFRPSRAVAFQTLSLIVIGSYFALMVTISRGLAFIGGDIARVSQILFLALAAALAVAWLPSGRMRGWLQVYAAKHLFKHRYDYREEWLRFTRTIGRGSSASASFHERAVQAVADITDSPAGLLLIPDEEARLELTARWNWPMIEVPAVAGEYAFSSDLERHNYILDLDEVRGGIDHDKKVEQVPSWLVDAQEVWALVPLVHFDRLVGCIVLARPRIMRGLDWEDFDLLRVVGQQLASYLAEQAGQQALMDASRFDEFNRRMAFVMHDIKNLASQLSLLAANARKHAENPEFRADMLVTLHKSSEKLNVLLDRLGRYGAGQVHELGEIDLTQLGAELGKRFENAHPLFVSSHDPVPVTADMENLEQALIHLVQNAIDASEPDAPIFVNAVKQGVMGRLDIIDNGSGMSPEFMRTGLFKPFVSSKQGGFGIGAFEARELIRAMGGRLMVESREGVGTRFSIFLPLRETADHADKNKPSSNARTAGQSRSTNESQEVA